MAARARRGGGSATRLAKPRLRPSAGDPPSSEHLVSAIEDRGLSRRDPERRLAQAYADVSARQRLDLRRERPAAVADLHLAARASLRRVRDPARRPGPGRGPPPVLARSGDHPPLSPLHAGPLKREA